MTTRTKHVGSHQGQLANASPGHEPEDSSQYSQQCDRLGAIAALTIMAVELAAPSVEAYYQFPGRYATLASVGA